MILLIQSDHYQKGFQAIGVDEHESFSLDRIEMLHDELQF